jgi:general secretion pathway protein A
MLNFQLNNLFLMTLILLGQPELNERVERIPQLNQRIAIRYHLAPFSADETYQYIRSRLKVAGAITEIFAKDAAFEIFQRTGGVSRLVNTLCDACLMLGAQEQLAQIDLSVVKRASRVL